MLKKESLEKQVDWYWQNWLPKQRQRFYP